MKKYRIRMASEYNHADAEYDDLHDAEVFVNTIRKINEHLDDKLKFHGWITCWEGYQLDDGSYVTTSAELVSESEF